MPRRYSIANHNQPGTPEGTGGLDQLQPFMLDASELRGRMVRLGQTAHTIISCHDYPAPIASFLAEMLSLTALLAGMLKFDGVFTLQVKGNGPITLAVCDLTNTGHLRGYVQYDADAAKLLPANQAPTLSQLCGGGYMAFTVDQQNSTDRYQGIVELSGDKLSDAVRHYFEQSEQIKTAFEVSVGQQQGMWYSAAIMLQAMPQDQNAENLGETDIDGWRRAMMLLQTVSSAELLDENLPVNAVLYRLFNEEGVRVFPPLDIVAKCRCSREKIAPIIEGLPQSEKEELAEDGKITVICEFCSHNYHFPVE
jgi:molecular chaperone Hsp33